MYPKFQKKNWEERKATQYLRSLSLKGLVKNIKEFFWERALGTNFTFFPLPFLGKFF